MRASSLRDHVFLILLGLFFVSIVQKEYFFLRQRGPQRPAGRVSDLSQ